MKKYLNPDTTYSLPSELKVVEHRNQFLVIAPMTASWIVLPSEKHIEILREFSNGLSIADLTNRFPAHQEELREVVTQLEARRFCNRKVRSATSDFKTLHLYLTNKCNLSCPHCYMFSGSPNQEELTTSEILTLVKNYAEAGGKRVTFSGGEPSVHKDFDKIVEEVYALGLKVRILTNGSLFDKERIMRLAHMIDSIQISIDGFSEETNSIIRGKGHFLKALMAVDGFIKQGVNVSVGVTPPYSLLEAHIDDYAKFAKQLGDKYGSHKILIKFSEGLLEGRDVCPTQSSNQKYFNLMQELNKKLHGSNYELVSFVHAVKQNVIMDNCMFGVFAVCSNGDVYFCARVAGLQPCANVRTTPFDEIVRLSNEAEKATVIDNLKPCKSCELRYICGGGCRIDEFPNLVNRSSFANVDLDSMEGRSCPPGLKTKFYDLMIQSNPYLYSQTED